MVDVMDDQTGQARMRAADADRQRVAEQLQSAYAEGRLDLGEYDDRVRQAWAARTYGELDGLTTDLPRERPPQPPVAEPARHQVAVGHQPGRCGSVATWLSASVINLVIWAVISLATLSWIYPWWIWVAGPWGAVLLANTIKHRFAPQPAR